MNYTILKILFWICQLSSFHLFSQSDSLNNYDIKLFLDKDEYFEGEDIVLKIELDFNKSESTIYFTPFSQIIPDVQISDDKNNRYRFKYYLMSLEHVDTSEPVDVVTLGNFKFPMDSIIGHETKILKTELNTEFTLVDSYWGKDMKLTEYLPPGSYEVKFESDRSYTMFYRWLEVIN